MGIRALQNIHNVGVILGVFFVLIGIITDLIVPLFETESNFSPICINPIAFCVYMAGITIKHGNKNKIVMENTCKVGNLKKLISIIIMILGICWFFVSSIIYVRSNGFMLNAVETTGIVIGYSEYKSAKHNAIFSIQYSYFDKNGGKHIKTGTAGSYPPEYPIGTEIKVFYNKNNFDAAIYESKTVHILYYVFGTGGLLIGCIGFIVYMIYKKKST